MMRNGVRSRDAIGRDKENMPPIKRAIGQ